MGFLSSLGRDLKGGTSAYKAFNDQRNAWVSKYLKSQGITPADTQGPTDSEGGGSSGMGFDADYNEEFKKAQVAWLDTLDPATRQKALSEFTQHSSDMDSIQKYGSMATKGLLTTIAGGAALQGAGLLGGASGGSTGAGGLSGLDAAAADMGAGLSGGAGGSVVPAAGATSGGGGLLSGLGGSVSSLLPTTAADWLKLATGAGGLINSLRSPETAKTPDYMALAREQARLDQEAADKALAGNRPDQVDAAGNTRKWTQDPVTGKWTQTDTLSAANQQLLNTGQGAQLDALRSVADRGDFNFEGDPLMDPVGNSKDIQDAWMNLLNPERQMARNSEIQRLKSQGLTEDSPAFQRAMLRLDQADTDAQNKALIAGTTEYGNQYNRSLNNRQQSFGEYQTDYRAPMDTYQGLMGIGNPQGNFGSFTTGQTPNSANVYGAGQDTYTANLASANATNAQRNNTTQGLFGLSGNIAKGGWGA